jgi:hypothetical protein
MYNIEEVHCTAAINSVLAANLQFLDATVEEALQPIARHAADKHDTLGLDGIPESTIANCLKNFDKSAVLITEEIGATSVNWLRERYQHLPPTIYVSDPTDRSSQLKEFLSAQNLNNKIGDIIEGGGAIAEWEKKFGAPASITGATSAITCVRYGIPINSAFVNFITQELFVAFRAGIFCLKLPRFRELAPDQITLEYIRNNGQQVFFRKFEPIGSNMDNMRYFVTFLGKSGYAENFQDSDLIRPDDAKRFLRYELPGGPSRILYLSMVEPEDQPVGFVFANGEKIIEWIHWLPFVRFGKIYGEPTKHALNLYEVHQERPWTKEGILMSTTPPYSIFSELKGHDGKMVIDIERLQSFSNPSRFRSTLLVAPTTNSWALTATDTRTYRQIEFVDQR